MQKDDIKIIPHISSLFVEEPREWGFRGDPYLWDEMRLKSKDVSLPETEELMREYLFKFFYTLTGSVVSSDKDIFIERFFYGSGMSGGVVNPKWWHEKGIPFILERYKKIKHQIAGTDYQIKDIYWKNETSKGFANSIENAVKRLMMFEDLHNTDLLKLLSLENSIDMLTEETRLELIDRISSLADSYTKLLEKLK
ncbi:hypothetical protein [Breznakiella homolactica]|uniref:Uncharacterized protein n=1 Tax=Breznakiella homolactica TaxID=2798577 RepID=A0A7T8BAL4_9SPIR|nr:hypothetical protein [Breznakiella homolactica]QQO09632.1 hypothetical protein JFL75_01560 [Breznakiella homolactica]